MAMSLELDLEASARLREFMKASDLASAINILESVKEIGSINCRGVLGDPTACRVLSALLDIPLAPDEISLEMATRIGKVVSSLISHDLVADWDFHIQQSQNAWKKEHIGLASIFACSIKSDPPSPWLSILLDLQHASVQMGLLVTPEVTSNWIAHPETSPHHLSTAWNVILGNGNDLPHLGALEYQGKALNLLMEIWRHGPQDVILQQATPSAVICLEGVLRQSSDVPEGLELIVAALRRSALGGHLQENAIRSIKRPGGSKF